MDQFSSARATTASSRSPTRSPIFKKPCAITPSFFGARDFEKSVAHYRSLGYAEAFSDTAPMGFRVVYFDTTRDLPGMLEVIEMNAAAEQGFHTMYQAAQEWDGKTHVVHQIETAQPA